MLRLAVSLYRFFLGPYFRLVRPKRWGAHSIVADDKGRVLLVRLTYMDGWHLPGGGVKNKETLEEAALREVYEEAGVIAKGRPELLGAYSRISNLFSDHVAIYVMRDWHREESVSSFEIAETRFFPIENLPPDTQGFVRYCIEEYAGRQPRIPLWHPEKTGP